jgi:hypothetical protein
MAKQHRWGERRSGEVRHCLRTECTVQVRNAFREWRPAPRAQWVSLLKQLLPDCEGGAVPMKPGR